MDPITLGLIGGGLGALGSLFGGGDQESRSSIDPESQDYIRNMRGYAQMFAQRGMPGLDPAFLAALSGMRGYADAGQMGLSAQTDPTQAMKFMNPFMASMNPMFDRMRASSLNAYNKNATGAGAFGARRDLGAGAAMRGVNEQQAQFSYTGFNDAMARAMQLANMGMGANQWMGEAGQYMTGRQREHDIGSLQMLQHGYGTPLSTTNVTPGQGGNPFQGFLGGAMTGLSFARPGMPGSARAGMSMDSRFAGPYNPSMPGYQR